MTLMGAIKQLHELQSAEDMPIYYKPVIAEVINVLLMDAQEVRHGHWIAHDMSIKDVPTEACSECGEWSYGYNEPYCQKCGAKMDEVKE